MIFKLDTKMTHNSVEWNNVFDMLDVHIDSAQTKVKHTIKKQSNLNFASSLRLNKIFHRMGGTFKLNCNPYSTQYNAKLDFPKN